jgi:hypothetical protein
MIKKIVITLTFLFLAFIGFSQGVLVRTTGTQTVEDMRLMAGLNLFVPIYNDSTAANASKGVDSIGAIFYDRSINGFRFRTCCPKRWASINDSTAFATLLALEDTAAALRAFINAVGNDTTLNGDVTGGIRTNTVKKIWNISIPTPVRGFLYYGGNAGNPYTWSLPTLNDILNDGAYANNVPITGLNSLAFFNGVSYYNGTNFLLKNTGGSTGNYKVDSLTGTRVFEQPDVSGVPVMSVNGVTPLKNGAIVIDSSNSSFVTQTALNDSVQSRLSNINGLIGGGANVTVSGLGTYVSPYVISSTSTVSGTVDSVIAGVGMVPDTITVSGTLNVDTSKIATNKALSDSIDNLFPLPNSKLQHSAVFTTASDGITIGSGGILTLGNTVAIGIDTTGTIATTTALKDTAASIRSAIGSGGITTLTGDVTASGTGSVAATLATVNSNVGSFTNANITVNGKGLVTAASSGSAGTDTTINVTNVTPSITGKVKTFTIPYSAITGNKIVAGANVTVNHNTDSSYTINSSGGGGSTKAINQLIATTTKTANYRLLASDQVQDSFTTNNQIIIDSLPASPTDSIIAGAKIKSLGSFTGDTVKVITTDGSTIGNGYTFINLYLSGETKNLTYKKSTNTWSVTSGDLSTSSIPLAISKDTTIKGVGTSASPIGVNTPYLASINSQDSVTVAGLPQYGTFISDTSYANFASNYYSSLGSMSLALSLGNVTIGAGSGSWSNYALENTARYGASELPEYDPYMNIKWTSSGNDTLGFLKQSGNPLQCGMLFGEGKAFIALNGTMLVKSPAITVTSGDVFYFNAHYTYDSVYFSITDSNTNVTTSTINYGFTYTTITIPNTGNYGFTDPHGSYILRAFRISSTTPKFASEAFLSTSKLKISNTSRDSTDVSIFNRSGILTLDLSSPGDNTANIISRLAEIIALHPYQVIAQDWWSNNVRQNVPLATTITDTKFISNTLKNAGIKLFFSCPYEHLINLAPIDSFLKAGYGSVGVGSGLYFPTVYSIGQTNAHIWLAADSVHPISPYYAYMANVYLTSGLIQKQNYRSSATYLNWITTPTGDTSTSANTHIMVQKAVGAPPVASKATIIPTSPNQSIIFGLGTGDINTAASIVWTSPHTFPYIQLSNTSFPTVDVEAILNLSAVNNVAQGLFYPANAFTNTANVLAVSPKGADPAEVRVWRNDATVNSTSNYNYITLKANNTGSYGLYNQINGTATKQQLFLDMSGSGGSTPNIVIDSVNQAVGIGSSVKPTSTLRVSGSFATAYVAKTASYTATITDCHIDFTANNDTLTLPTAVGIAGRSYIIKNTGSGWVKTFTTSSQTFTTLNGTPTTMVLGSKGSETATSDGANWMVDVPPVTKGVATLSGGTITVTTPAALTNSTILLTDVTTGALTNVGTPTVGTVANGTYFQINSSNVLDASNINWTITP